MPGKERFTRERIERAARIYHSNGDAGAALGIAAGSFARLCKRYGIATPPERLHVTEERCTAPEESNHATAVLRIPHLLNTPADVLFLSCEPLLGQIDLTDPACNGHQDLHLRLEELGIRWVIAGGESGPRARPMNLSWARSLRDQCKEAGVAFFMKQLSQADSRHFKEFESFPEDLQIREFPTADRQQGTFWPTSKGKR